MIFLYLFLTLIFGVSIGGYLQKRLTEKAIKLETEKFTLAKKNQFLEVLSKIRNGESVFKTRVNDTVYVEADLINIGKVDVIYLMDKNDVAIFQGAQCLNTSDGIQKEIITEIISSIYRIYNKNINDVVQILGFTFYREEFERTFRIKAEDLKKANLFESPQIDEIDKIKSDNKRKFDIDDILDKISAFGIASLSIEERLFLDNYSNEKRN
jgi:hypothetical protein